eukprot:12718447-Alexandrium_andersonii.AAC.1
MCLRAYAHAACGLHQGSVPVLRQGSVPAHQGSVPGSCSCRGPVQGHPRAWVTSAVGLSPTSFAGSALAYGLP